MASDRAIESRGRRDELVGVGILTRFLLRVDRTKGPGWVAGIGAMALYVSVAVPVAYRDDLEGAVQVFSGPVGRLLTGPGHGLDEPTLERLVAGGYGLYFMLLSALMSILLVVRHTRAEEQSGRAELVRASVVGREAGLVAALVVALLTNLAAGAAVFVVLVAVGGFAVAGSALLGCSVAAVGLAFGAVAAVTAQLSRYARVASGLAGGVLAGAFVLRGGGDLAREGGSVLSWLSPLGWAQQAGPYVLDRWWPLLLLLGFAAVTTAVAFALADRRDLGASFLADRPGPARAHPSLGSVWGLAWRLQRPSIVGWTASLAVAGFVFGLFAEALGEAAEDLPEVMAELFGTEDLVAGYLAVMAFLLAVMVAVQGVLAVQALLAEETSGRGATLLAAPVRRAALLLAATVTAGAGMVLASLAAGAASGLGAAVVTGDAHHVGDLVLAQLNLLPSALVALGVATVLYGAWPRALGAAWVVVGWGFVVGTFGELLDLPGWARALDPFHHPAPMPLEPFAAAPVVVLSAVAVVAVGLGAAGLTRREYEV